MNPKEKEKQGNIKRINKSVTNVNKIDKRKIQERSECEKNWKKLVYIINKQIKGKKKTTQIAKKDRK